MLFSTLLVFVIICLVIINTWSIVSRTVVILVNRVLSQGSVNWPQLTPLPQKGKQILVENLRFSISHSSTSLWAQQIVKSAMFQKKPDMADLTICCVQKLVLEWETLPRTELFKQHCLVGCIARAEL